MTGRERNAIADRLEEIIAILFPASIALGPENVAKRARELSLTLQADLIAGRLDEPERGEP